MAEVTREVDDWINSYLDYTSNTEPRESFRRWCAISGIAAALQRKVFLPFGMETFYPNMYIVLVGPPAARKGTAIKPIQYALDRLGINIAASKLRCERLIKSLVDTDAMHTDGDGYVHSHCSLTIIAPELTVFLGYNNPDLLSILNEWFDCLPRFRYETHIRGVEEVLNVWVNLLGATTPTLIQLSLPTESIGSGFTSRTVFVYEENKGKIVIVPSLTDAQKEIGKKLLTDLGTINTMCGRIRFEEGVIEKYGIWRELAEASPPFDAHKLEFYSQRRHVHLLKLCMIYSVSRGGDMVIRSADIDRAKRTLSEVEKKMPLVFEGMGSNPLGHIQLETMKIIGRNKKIHFSELMRIFRDDVTKDDMMRILHTLAAMKFCRIDVLKGDVHYTEMEKE